MSREEYLVSIPVRVLDVLKHFLWQRQEPKPERFNPCKGFRCFEATSSRAEIKPRAVSIPVRVLDVLKPAALNASP